MFDEAVALEAGAPTLVSLCLHWPRIVRDITRYWPHPVTCDGFSPVRKRVKEALRMTEGCSRVNHHLTTPVCDL